jgi:hypothetical protein
MNIIRPLHQFFARVKKFVQEESMHGLSNCIKLGAAAEGETADAPLFRGIEEFWALEKLKGPFVPGEGVVHLSSDPSEELDALQRRVAASFRSIRGFSCASSRGRNAKLGVLKYRAVATDFQENDIFREIVALLDEIEGWSAECGQCGFEAFDVRPPDKKIGSFNLQKFFKNFLDFKFGHSHF